MTTVFNFVLVFALGALQGLAVVATAEEAVELEEMPFVAYLDHDGEPCTASVLNNFWVLTAATCLNISDKVTVRVGSISSVSGGVVYEVIKKVIHPYYSAHKPFGMEGKSHVYRSNYGLAKVKTPIKMKSGFATVSSEAAHSYSGADAVRASWGGTFIYRDNMSLPAKWETSSTYLQKATTRLTTKNIIFSTNDDFSVHDDDTVKLHTMGDLGAPIAVQQDGKWVQIGILSQNHFGLGRFADVSSMSLWILEHTNT